jgi:hypothetical protein
MVAAATPASAQAPAPAAGPCADPTLKLRCPDLVTSAPANLHLDRTTEPGHVLLRARSVIRNAGSGPLELIARRQASQAMAVIQAIYDTAGARHVFATPGRVVFKHVPGNRYDRPGVGNFAYWKFHLAATFQLWLVDASRRAVSLVATGPKLDYCFRDLVRGRPSGPGSVVYPACSQRAGARRVVLGLSVGWEDVYPYEYPEQWIDVTGLRGTYAYVQIANPTGALYEANAANNVSETYVSLPSGRVLGRRTDLAAP